MASPKYFQNFPSIKYAVRADKAGNVDYINIVDYFKMMRVREDILKKDSFYTPYRIQDGETPETIAYQEYGDEQYYWIILQLNNITDYYNQWPLSNAELERYAVQKYGSVAKAEEVHHYETSETRTEDGLIILAGGIVVDSDFSFTYPSKQGSTVFLTATASAVTNMDYERAVNERKTDIEIINKKYVADYAREFRKYVRNEPVQQSEIDISEVY